MNDDCYMVKKEGNEMEPVSVIIPTYNRAQCIEMSVKSVLKQTYYELELLVVDDGSTDATEGIVSNINDSRIRYIKMPINGGPSAARNYGVKESKYNIIAFHDSDDIWTDNKLEKQVEELTCNASLGMVYTQTQCIDQVTGENWVIPYEGVSMECRSGKIFPYLLIANYISTPVMLMWKNCFKKVGGFDEVFRCLEDWDLALRIAKYFEIGYIDEPLHISYKGDPNSVDSSIVNHIKSKCMMVKKYRDDYLKYGLIDKIVDDILSKSRQIGKEREAALILSDYLRG